MPPARRRWRGSTPARAIIIHNNILTILNNIIITDIIIIYAREAALAALDACPSPCFLLHLARDPSLKFRCLFASGRHSCGVVQWGGGVARGSVQVPALSPPSSSGAYPHHDAAPIVPFRCRRFPHPQVQVPALSLRAVSGHCASAQDCFPNE